MKSTIKNMVARSFSALGCFLSFQAVAVDAAEQGELPEGYTKVPYLESDGTAYINTGVMQTGDAVAEMKIQFSSLPGNGGYYSYFGARDVSTELDKSDQFGAWIHNDGGTVWHRTGINETAVDVKDLGEVKVNTDYDVVLRKSGVCTINGQTLGTGNELSFHSHTYYLFALNQSGSATWGAKARIYSCRISTGGAVQREFVPCQDSNGVLGMYDIADNGMEKRFYANASTSGRFTCEAAGERLSAIESDGDAYIDTGVTQTVDAVTELKIQFASLPENGSYYSYFGARDVSTEEDKSDQFGAWIHNDNGSVWHRSGVSETTVDVKSLGEVKVNTDYDVVLRKSGVCTINGQTLGTGNELSYHGLTYYLFALNQSNVAWWGAKARMYSCRISTGGELQREYVPFRTLGGMIGLFDLVHQKFYPSLGSGGFTAFGVAYDVDGSKMNAHSGDLQPTDVIGYREICKTTSGELTAGKVTEYPGALTLAGGTFSLKDGVARDVAVGGALTLNGGTTLRIDLTADGCDCFDAKSLDLGGASVAKPITLKVSVADGDDISKEWMTIIRLPKAEAGSLDADKFAVTWDKTLDWDKTTVLRVVDGELQLKSVVLPEGYTKLPYLESDGTAYIDTGVRHCADAIAELKVQFAMPPDNNGFYAYFGGRDVMTELDKSDQFGAWIHNDNGSVWHRTGFNAVATDVKDLGEVKVDTDYEVVFRKNGVCTINGQTLGEGSGVATRDYTYYLFAINQSGKASWGAKARIYSCRISTGGELQREFVPCRNPNGVLGMYDIAENGVEKRFYANAAASGSFTCEADGVQLLFLESDGAAYINTGVRQAADAVAEMKIQFSSLPENGGYYSYFGARDVSTELDKSDQFGTWIHNDGGNVWHRTGISEIAVDVKDLGEVKVNTDYDVVLRKNDVCTVNGQTLGSGNGLSFHGLTYYLFALNQSDVATWGTKARIYSCQISTGGELQREFVPFRRWDGALGMLDLVHRKFYPNAGSGSFSILDSAADGTTLKISNGVVFDSDLDGFEAVEKTLAEGVLDVSHTTSLRDLTVSEGTVTIAGDRKLTQVPISGTLALKGGTTLALDVTAAGCDSFAPTAVDLSGVNEANPVRIVVDLPSGLQIEKYSEYFLIAAGLRPGDEKKFALDVGHNTERIRLDVVAGALRMHTWPSGWMFIIR